MQQKVMMKNKIQRKVMMKTEIQQKVMIGDDENRNIIKIGY
jgi:hypothetical protein